MPGDAASSRSSPVQTEPATVDVVLPVPVDQAYTYGVPAELEGALETGSRVLVPFGSRRLTGVVVGEGDPPSALDFEVKEVLDVLDDTPTCTRELLRLTRWLANYYVCRWGEALKAALPAGTTAETERRLARTDAPPSGWDTHAVGARVLDDLEANGETTLSALRKRLGEPVPLSVVRRMDADGVVALETTVSDPKASPKTQTHVRFAPAFRAEDAAAEAKKQLRGAKQTAVVEVMAGLAAEGVLEPLRTDVMERADASYSTVRSLVDKGILETVEKEVMRSPLDSLPDPDPPPDHTLNEDQREALAAVGDAVEAKRYETFLLHGVTGSGKTEVYIAALKRVLEQGRSGIILVPEIALTPQTVQRFRSHFGDRIAVLHSQMSMGERYDAWRGLREGRLRIAIGPRSAVLAPLDDLGLIVVDEEHEHSYKQFDPAPRYHARDAAVMRAHMNDAVCVLGSATPSLESTMNARWGKYTRLTLPERVPDSSGAAAEMPAVRVVDLTLQRRKHQLEGALSTPLRSALRERLERGEQTILLQNRRGYSPVLECEDCGWAPVCDDCSVTMTYHKAKRHLRCHYCGRTRPLPQRCPECRSSEISRIGTGTQRVEEELEEVVPDASVLRMDRDTTGQRHAHQEILERFRSGADVLLGTQMIAKGLDFSRVTLVGVVDADVGLLLPDFRSEERTFQLLTQVAGRAGRADLKGEVILQTRNPDHAAIRHAAAHDYAGFAEEALAERRRFNYPPFGHIAGVEFRGPDEQRVERLAETWTDELRRHAGPVDVLGPEPAFIERVKRQHRFRTILKARKHGLLRQALHRTREAHGSVPNGYHVSIDVDALGLL
jgi:primosomal protein N' (replication factor Y)